MYLNSGTLKLKASANANSSFVCGPTSQTGGPIDGLHIYGGIFDGNRTNNTDGLVGSALLYCVSSSNMVIEDTIFQNYGQGDGAYFGGDSSGAGKSSYITFRNIQAIGNFRNNVSIVGVDQMFMFGGKFNSATNSQGHGPQCGIDFEPNGSSTSNTNIKVFGATADQNGQTGLTTTGASGFCIYGAAGDTSNIQFHGISANQNKHYGIETFATPTIEQITLHGIRGNANLSGIVAGIRDFLATGIGVNSADSCGAGFRCVRLPN